jgi:hypothetical protein
MLRAIGRPSPVPPIATGLQTVEGLEHRFQLLWRDARAGILDRQPYRLARPVRAGQHQPRRSAIGQRIAHQIGQRPLECHRPGQPVRLAVEDAGPGIPPEQLEAVFQPFHRLETSRNRETGGTGLGLPIARNILRAHGGDVVLRNRPGGGLVALATLPG